VDYSGYQGLDVSLDGGIASVVMKFQGEDHETRRHQHRELTTIWRQFDADDQVKVALITGVGEDEFYLSGRPPGSGASRDDHDAMWRFTLHLEGEVADLVRELTRFQKPLIAAVNGAAGGAGLAVVMLSDISIMASDAWVFDPHIMLGISAGDGPGGIWPLYTGIAKAKLYLLTSDALNGDEAERIGLVSRSVPRPEVLPVAKDYAERLARAPATALRYTKRGINQWLRLAEVVSQDYSVTLEALSEYSGERAGNPHTEWPPRQVP
jgi:enoyl-CoA hydratase/carnithine racemase